MDARSFAERFRSKPENAAKAALETAARSKTRVDRSAYWYVKLHFAQLDQLEKMNDPIAFMLFGILLRESFERRGKPFELPTQRLTSIPGLRDMKRIRAKLNRLEQYGLISVIAQPSKPRLIRVPLAL